MGNRKWIFTTRLRQARERKGVSQRRLGILMGFHEDSASSRVNHYEHGRHEPGYETVKRLAKVLGVPMAYFYAEDELLAEVILLVDASSDAEKRKVLRSLKPK